MTQDHLLDKELQPPYTPPSTKLLSMKDIEFAATQKTPVLQEIEKSAGKIKKGKKPQSSKYPNWDQNF